MIVSKNLRPKILVYLCFIVLLNIAGLAYYINYFTSNGYLPNPFFYEVSDTFMDLFNTMYWAYDNGRYTDWGSVYPPFSFIILRLINFLFAGEGHTSAALMRDNSPFVIAGFCLIYLTIPAIILKSKYWGEFLKTEKILIYFAIILSAPMLFALERGNIIMLCPVLLALVVSKLASYGA